MINHKFLKNEIIFFNKMDFHRKIIPETFFHIDKHLLPELANICCSYLIKDDANYDHLDICEFNVKEQNGNDKQYIFAFDQVYDAFLYGCGEIIERTIITEKLLNEQIDRQFNKQFNRQFNWQININRAMECICEGDNRYYISLLLENGGHL